MYLTREQLGRLMCAAYIAGARDGHQTALEETAAAMAGEIENASDRGHATVQLMIGEAPVVVEKLLKLAGI